jgi:MoxR-like ATPase
MNIAITVSQKELMDVLLNIAVVRPVFIWGAPGIGKSSLVEQFASALGLPCVSLLGSQLAPEDIIGVPQIIDGKSVFCPPRIIAQMTVAASDNPGDQSLLPDWFMVELVRDLPRLAEKKPGK